MRLRSLLTVVLVLLASSAIRASDKDGFEDTFNLKPDDFATTGKNDYFILEPGYQLVLEGKDKGEAAKLVITVLDETKTVDGVETRIVEERETLVGEPVEVSRNFFAIDKHTRDVYYFGEEVDEYNDGKVATHGGAWESGKNGAHYGLMMPAEPKVGQKHYQEIAPKVAMDRAEVISLNEKQSTPAGEFEHVLKTKETTPIEPDEAEYKLYAKGVGLLVDGNLKLTKHGKNVEPRGAAADAKKSQAKKPAAGGKIHTPDDAPVVVPVPVAREALALVGADEAAEHAWVAAINDPNVTPHDRSDLIEDLNEVGIDPKNLSGDDVPLIVNRLELIEALAPDAMDQVNADAFAEAYKDLNNMLRKAVGR